MLERLMFLLWQMMYKIRGYFKAQYLTQRLYNLYLLVITCYIKAYNVYKITRYINNLPKTKRDDLVFILETLSSKDGDKPVAGDLHMQSATHGLPEKEEVISGEYKISVNIVECQVNKTEI